LTVENRYIEPLYCIEPAPKFMVVKNMNKHYTNSKIISSILLALTIYSPVLHAAIFEDNFDGPDGLNTTSNWQWKAPYGINNLYGMMYSQNDIYTIINYNNAHSGNKVLKLKFDNRNLWCNSCGNQSHTVTSSEIVSGCININGTVWGDYVFNKSRGWTRWDISSYSSNSVCFNKNAPSANSMLGDNGLVAGDVLKVVRKCGVNGTIGGDIKRRSDCGLAINFLQNIQKTDFDYGATLSRRLYLLIDKSAVVPNVGIKLGYAKFSSGSTIPFISFQNGWRLENSTFFGYSPTSVTIQKDKWYYIEETWSRESSVGAGDGTYKLYGGEENSPDLATPLVSQSGLTYGDISAFSIIGNWQHFNDANGSMYIDDVLISKSYIGPTNAQIRPNPPTNLKVVANH